MEAFSLLKYWRGGGSLGATATGGGGNVCVNARSATTAGGTNTIVSAATAHQAVETDDDDDDDGPFFDLEFAVSDEEETEDGEEIDKSGNVEDETEDQHDEVDTKSDDGCSDDEREFNFTLSSGSSNDRSDPNITLSPSDDLFFKGRLVPIESNSGLESKTTQFPVSLLKSATKFRVFLLRFKKSKLNSTEKTESSSADGSVSEPSATPKKQETTQEENNNNNNSKNKFFTVKFKFEEVPMMSLFSRDNSKSQKQQSSEDSASDEKKFSKDVMQKYLKKVKPLYVRVSRRYGEKLRFSGQLSLGSLKPATPPSTAAQNPVPGKAMNTEKGQVEVENEESQVNGKNFKQINIPAGLRVVRKHLGKSRSASSAVAAAPSPTLSQRRDDSLLLQQDGIQSAILHCKRSFNGSRDSSVFAAKICE